MKSIPERCFTYCSSLEKITIPNNIQSIDSQAFLQCDNLKSVTILNGVQKIGKEAFNRCVNLKSINIPFSVSTISEYAFANTQSLEKIDVVDNNPNYCSVDGIVYNKDKTSFVAIPCGIKRVSIPDTITEIGNEQFYLRDKLVEIQLPESLKSIGKRAFEGCNSLTSISIPKSVTTIDTNALGYWLEYTGYAAPMSKIKIPGFIIRCYKQSEAFNYANANKLDFEIIGSIHHEAVSEDCTQDGSIEYWLYENKYYKDRACSIEVQEEDIRVKALGHIFDEPTYVWSNNNMTCTAKRVCLRDESHVETETVNAERTVVSQPTCTKEGKASYVAQFSNNAFENQYLQNQSIDPIGHDYKDTVVAPTCTSKGYTNHKCTRCNDEYNDTETDMLAHSFGDWITTTAPTCTDKGVETRKCKNCEATETRDVKALGHDYVASIVPPTCTSKGYTNHKCTRCKDEYNDSETQMTAHSFGDWRVTTAPTCTAKGVETRTCSECKKTETRDVNALGHDYKATVVAPTCTAKGYTLYKCSRCNDEFKDNYTEPTGNHKWSEWKTTAFDVNKGTSTQTRTCSACNKTESKTTKNAVQRLAGSGRYETATKISQAAFDQADTVVLAYGLNYADALAGVSLAKAMNAPILLTNLKTLPAETLAEIKRLKAKNVIILGGTGAVGAEVETALIKEGFKTKRIAGATRFETATKIAEKMQKLNDKAPEEVYFVYAFNSADALSVSPIAASKNAPIIYLSTKGDLNADTAAYLAKLKMAGCVKNAYVIGGEGVISNDMMKKAGSALGVTPVRVFGANRFSTCVAVNEKFADVPDSDMLCVATGMDFPDALAGGVYAAINKAPLFLINGKLKTPKLTDEQKSYLKTKAAGKITAFGGTGVVPDNHIADIAKNSI